MWLLCMWCPSTWQSTMLWYPGWSLPEYWLCKIKLNVNQNTLNTRITNLHFTYKDNITWLLSYIVIEHSILWHNFTSIGQMICAPLHVTSETDDKILIIYQSIAPSIISSNIYDFMKTMIYMKLWTYDAHAHNCIKCNNFLAFIAFFPIYHNCN